MPFNIGGATLLISLPLLRASSSFCATPGRISILSPILYTLESGCLIPPSCHKHFMRWRHDTNECLVCSQLGVPLPHYQSSNAHRQEPQHHIICSPIPSHHDAIPPQDIHPNSASFLSPFHIPPGSLFRRLQTDLQTQKEVRPLLAQPWLGWPLNKGANAARR